MRQVRSVGLVDNADGNMKLRKAVQFGVSVVESLSEATILRCADDGGQMQSLQSQAIGTGKPGTGHKMLGVGSIGSQAQSAAFLFNFLTL